MDTFVTDVRYSLRTLARSPGFTLVAVLTLALGIGTNTAIFSVLDAVLLRPLPYPAPEKLVKVWTHFTGIGLPNDQNWVSAPEFVDLRTFNRSLSAVAALSSDSFNISAGALPERVEGARVSVSLFEILGVQPRIGRRFLSGEDQPGHDSVALLGHDLWQRRFGADPAIVGRKVQVNGVPSTIVGVLPPGFRFPVEAELWTPLAFTPEELGPGARGSHAYEVLARIRPDVSLNQAREDMAAVTKRVIEQNQDYPYRNFHFAITIAPLLEEMVGDVRLVLWILIGAVGFVLLIACANVANLLLARAAGRERELAVRSAMGASRGRLVRQLLTESVILSAAGAAVGLLAARWGLQALNVLSATALPRAAEVVIDLRVLAFTLIVAFGTGVVFGLVPALQASRSFAVESLKEGGHGATVRALHHGLRRALIVAEVALALVLLAGTGLLIRSFVRVLEVDPGFNAGRVLTLRLGLPEARYSKPEQIRGFYQGLLDRVGRLPGVRAAGAVSSLPLGGSGTSGTVTVDTTAVPPQNATPEADWRPVTPGYFEAMGIALVRGRFFDARDNESAAPVAIIDESMASTYWPNQDPIGRRIRLGGSRSTRPWMRVVGVVRHVRYRTLEARSRVQLYWPEAQNPWPSLSLAIRTASDPDPLAAAVQKQVLALDPDQPIYGVRTMEQLVSESVARRRFSMSLLSLFAGVALLLASVGLYGVLSYLVTQRVHEIGIRVALGATRGGILRLVFGQSLSLTLAGIVVGLAGALAVTRLLSSLLFEVSATDPVTFGVVVPTLVAVAALAGIVPAHRATRVDPIVALRQE